MTLKHNLKLPLPRWMRQLSNRGLPTLKKLLRTKRRKVLVSALAFLILVTALQTFLLLRPARAGWSPSHGLWAKRKQLTITNNSSDSLASGTAVAITVNTKELYDAGKLQDDCDDLRIVYSTSSSNHKEIDRYLEFPSGTTCATSEATKVYLQLQAALGSGSSSTDYYLYYSNSKASPTVATFDTSSQTFTASMSKRSAPGPFTAAPIVQGTTVSDTLSFSRGNQISGSFYENKDSSAGGSFSFWITPEWDGNDNVEHRILSAASGAGTYISKNSSNNLCAWNNTPDYSWHCGPDISSWTAGTTYQVVFRWDPNTIDGTNYFSFSVNDTHTYFNSTDSPSTQADSTVYIGTNRSDVNGSDGIVEGLTIYRRPLYDGTYGIDVGNGDEINLIYNSGTGKDPTLITGSWDVVFALPTDSSVGALATGTGEAWSHPYSSNLMYDTTTNTGGFMLNGTYTTDSWSDEGTPSSVAGLAASEKIFAGGYKVTSDAVDEGIYYTETVTAGDDWVIRALGNSDGTCDPKVILYDQTGTAEIGSLAGTTTSTRTAPDVYLFTGEAPTSSTELRVKLINTAATGTCYWHQVELYSNVVDNPSLEGTYSGTPPIPSGWTNDGLDSGDSEEETTIVHSGSKALQINTGASNEGIRTGNLSTTTGEFLGTGMWGYGDGGSGESRWRSYSTNRLIGQDGTTWYNSTTTAAWTHLPIVIRSLNTDVTWWRIFDNTTIASPIYADDAYAVPLDDVSLTVTPATITNSTESSGIRVDGRDTLTQTLSAITVAEGAIKFKYTPRHDAADQLKFLDSTDVYIAEFYGDSDDYIRLYWNAANTITLAYSMAGTTGSTTWDATSAIVADTTYELRIEYNGGGDMEFFIDGAKRITLTSIPAEFGVTPTTAYWGSRQNGDRQADATYAAPTTTSEVTDDVFDIGSKDALLVCPFDGSTTCVGGETPSTESGAIRYSGSKSAIELDGGDDYVQINNWLSAAPDAITLEAWVYFYSFSSSYSGNGFEVFEDSCCSRYSIYVSTAGAVSGFVGGQSAGFGEPTGSITTNTWYHLAVSYDGSEIRVFIDGTEVADNTSPGALSAPNTNMLIGGRGANNQTWPGRVDEARISTVARYTSNFTPSTAPFVRDEHTLALLHFDENGDDPRNTGKAIDDSGNGNDGTITGAKYVGGLIGIDGSPTPGVEEGKTPGVSYASHEGIFIEEATTNKITNPSFDHATYNTNWTASGGTSSENTTAPYYKFGSKSYKLVLADATDQNAYISINAGNTNTHNLSAYVYRGTSGNVGGTVDNTVAQLYWQGTAQSGTTYTDMGGGWWRLSYSAAGTASAQNYGVTVVEDSGTIYIDGVQLEENNQVTTYTDGTLGTGYSWSGTAHDSTSSRTAPGDLAYTEQSLTGLQVTGTISFWLKPNWNADDNVDHGIGFSSTAQDTIYFWKRSGGSNNQAWVQANGTSTNAGSANTWLTTGNWAFVTITWADPGNLQLWFNGTSQASTSYDSTGASFGTVQLRPLFGARLESLISDLRIFDNELTSAEITDLYQAGLVSRQEGIEVDRFSEEKGQNPVAIYHFDESYGTTASDSSTYGNNLTVSGATWETQSVGGRSRLERNLKFDGSNDYASRAWDRDFNFGTGSFSISGWFRHPSTITDTDTILARYGDAGYKVYMDSSGFVCFGIDDDSTWTPADSACTTTSYADSKWYQFEAVKNGTTDITLYINGNQVAQDASLLAAGSLNSSATLYIGIDSDGSSNPWDGFLDEIVIYPYARDASQVKEDFLGSQTAQVYGAASDDFLTEGLVAYLPMDETSADTCTGGTNDSCDYSSNGHDGLWGGAATTTAGKFGNGVLFDGTDDNVELTKTSALDVTNLDAFTISAWINYNDATADAIANIISYRETTSNNYGFRLKEGTSTVSNISFYVEKDNVVYKKFTSSSVVNANQWVFVTAIFDSGTISILIDGNLAVIEDGSTGSSDTGGKLWIGQGNQNNDHDFGGSIDEVRIYNRALSPAEVEALYNWGPGPVGYWNFDEGTGTTTVYDRSGNGYNVAMNGSMTEDDWVPGKFGSALDFDGSDDYLLNSASSGLSLTGSITLGAWIKADTHDGTIIYRGAPDGNYNNYSLSVTTSGALRFGYRNSAGTAWHDFTSSSTYQWTDGWHYAAVSHTYGSGSATKLFRDGVEIAGTWTTGTGNEAPYTDGNVSVAERGTGSISTDLFNGYIDEVKIYNYARTGAQIIEDMNGGHPVGGSPLPSQIGYWKFDEGYGDAINDSGSGGNNGDLAGSGTTCPQSADSACPTWTNSGKFGKALDFDTAGTTDDYVGVGTGVMDFSADNSNFSMTAWIKTTTSGADNYILGTSVPDGWYVRVDNGVGGLDSLLIKIDDGTDDEFTYGTTALDDGVWHHIALTLNSTSNEFFGYVDGTKEISLTTGLVNDLTDDLEIGRVDTQYFNGQIDEVKIYNTALTADQVKLDYNQGKAAVWGATSTDSSGNATWSAANEYCPPGQGSTCAGPVGEWKFDEKTGTTANDTSGNDNNGTFNGDPEWMSSADCYSGACLDLDQTNDYLNAGSDTTLDDIPNSDFSVTGWIYNDNTTDFTSLRLFTKGTASSGWYVQVTNSNTSPQTWRLETRVNFATTDAYKETVPYSGQTTAQQWVHFAMLFDSTTDSIRMFFNGNEPSYIGGATNGSGAYQADNTTNLLIGSTDTGSNDFDGRIDNLRVYGYELSQAQLMWDYNRGEAIGYWKLDECSGTTVNDSGSGGNNGTITIGSSGSNTSAGTCGGSTGEAWNDGESGKRNGSLEFDGTDDKIVIGSPSNLESFSAFTLSAWIYPTSGGQSSASRIISKSDGVSGDDYALIWNNNESIRFRVTTSSTSNSDGPGGLPLNQWYHFLGVWDGSNMSSYVNGKQVNFGAKTGTLTNSDDNLTIGTHDDTPTNRRFPGKIDEVKIFNYAFTQQQIQTLYNQGAVRFGPQTGSP